MHNKHLIFKRVKQALRHILSAFIFLSAGLSLHAQTDGLMFSMTYGGGITHNPQYGVINQFDPLTNYDTAIVKFTGNNGNEGYGNFIQLSNGLLYGMTAYGGNGLGNIIQYNIQTGQSVTLYSLPASYDSGAYLFGTLCHASNDLLYGLAYYGGVLYSRGVLFSFNYHTGAYQVLVQLNVATTGGFPVGSLTQVTDSLLYGMTTSSVNSYPGTIFKYNIYTGDTNRVYTFKGGTDGSYPSGSLTKAGNGLLYGLTEKGGTNGDGVLFSFDTHSNTETVLVNFLGPNGATPYRSLILAADSNLYGTTIYGGAHDSGTIFSYNIGTNTETVLYSFNGSDTDGYYPYSDLIQASDGKLYGCTLGNAPFGIGKNNWGTIFSYDIGTHAKKTLYYYNDSNGAFPYGDLLEVMTVNTSVTNNSCPNDSGGALTINVRGGKPPFTYLWSNGATTQFITNLKSGVYSDTVWDSRGIEFVNIDTVKPLPMVLHFNVSNACFGSNVDGVSVTISGGTSPFSYLWSTGATSDTLSNLPAGTYTCTIKDANGCPVSNTVVITQAPAIAITNITATEQTYPYDNGKITVTVSGGIPPGDSVYYYYLWSNGGPSDSSTITQLDSGSYAVCVTSPYGCGSVCDSNIIVLTGTKNSSDPGDLIKIYPVPTRGPVTIYITGATIKNIEVADALGRPVYTESFNSMLKDNIIHIDLSKQPDGLYILYLSSQQGIVTRKIIIQK